VTNIITLDGLQELEEVSVEWLSMAHYDSFVVRLFA